MNKRFTFIWLPLAIGSTAIFIITYAAIQQSYRSAANDPQIEVVQTGIQALSTGLNPSQLFTGLPSVDMNSSPSLFVMVFDSSGKLAASSGVVGSSTPPLPPPGIFSYVNSHGQDRVTWQTPNGRRFAAVVDKFESPAGTGYFLAARSLAETESREQGLTYLMLFGWIGTLVFTALASWVAARYFWYTELIIKD